MTLDDVRDFANRDWSRLAELKSRSWLRTFTATSIEDRLVAAERSRQLARELRPGWPTAADRRADRAHHERMRKALSRVQP